MENEKKWDNLPKNVEILETDQGNHTSEIITNVNEIIEILKCDKNAPVMHKLTDGENFWYVKKTTHILRINRRMMRKLWKLTRELCCIILCEYLTLRFKE